MVRRVNKARREAHTGWFGESYRHSLASHGIATSRKPPHTTPFVVHVNRGLDPRDKLDLQTFGYEHASDIELGEKDEDVGQFLRERKYLEMGQKPTFEDVFNYARAVLQEEITGHDFSEAEDAVKPFEHTNDYQLARTAMAEGYAKRVEEMINAHTMEWWVKEYGW